MNIPPGIQRDGHQLRVHIGERDHPLRLEVICPGREECAMEPWPPPNGERTQPCYLQWTLDDMNLDAVEGEHTFGSIPVAWRVEGFGEDAELWVMVGGQRQ